MDSVYVKLDSSEYLVLLCLRAMGKTLGDRYTIEDIEDRRILAVRKYGSIREAIVGLEAEIADSQTLKIN